MSHPVPLCFVCSPPPPPSYELRHTYNSNCACRDHLITTRLCWIQVYTEASLYCVLSGCVYNILKLMSPIELLFGAQYSRDVN